MGNDIAKTADESNSRLTANAMDDMFDSLEKHGWMLAAWLK